jgi:hypothetical protein
MGEQQFHMGHGLSQTLKQDGRCASFTQRNRMNPNPFLTSTLLVMTQSFLYELTIERLGLRTLAQLSAQQRLRQAHEHAIKPK